MKNSKYAWGIASTIAFGIIVYMIRHKKKDSMEKKLVMISDAGYELADDILFPLERKRYRRR